MSSNPRTLTFLFTDLENSTPLWEKHPDLMQELAARHDALIREAIEAHRGRVVKTTGDGFHAVFDAATDGVAAAIAGQQAMIGKSWPAETGLLKVRMGLHTGESREREGDYYGPELNRAVRVMGVAHGGQILVSEATAVLIRKSLPTDVSLSDLGPHRLKGIAAAEQIFQLCHPTLPADFPPLNSLSATPTNIPVQATPFVGRQEELTTLQVMLVQEGRRLITFIGPGGTGKTRLAIEVATQQHTHFNDGAFFVSLASLNEVEQIVQAIIEAASITITSGDDQKAQLLRYLRRKCLLLVIDNFEHLIDGAHLVSDILEAAPGVTVLATSREKLNLMGESVLPVGGLKYADWQTPEEVLADAAGQLFVQAAERAQPGFQLKLADTWHLAQISKQVQGMPLAILLAAAWTDTLSPREIASEIEDSLDFLETELRDIPVRQRSIRAVFEGSWERLAPAEQDLFKRLSVFRGGFTRQAAATAAGASPRALARLVNKSFLLRNPDSGRYEIHELLRQFTAERLENSPENSMAAREAHAGYYAQLIQQLLEPLRSPRQRATLDEIEADIENVRSAWRQLATQGRAADMSRMIETLWNFHEIRGWYHAGLDLLKAGEAALRALANDDESEVVMAQIRGIRGYYTTLLGSPQQGAEMITESLSNLRRLDRRGERLILLSGLGVSYFFVNSGAEAGKVAQEALDIATEMRDSWWEASGYSGLATASMIARAFDDARRYAEQAARLWDRIGDPRGKIWPVQVLGGLATMHGNYAEARERYLIALETAQSVNFGRGLQYTYSNLGNVSYRLKDYQEAEGYFLQSLGISDEIGHTREMLATVSDMARVRAVTERGGEAIELLAIVLKHPAREQHGLLRPATIQEDAEQLRMELKAALSPEEYAAAWGRGIELELQSVVDELLTDSGLQGGG